MSRTLANPINGPSANCELSLVKLANKIEVSGNLAFLSASVSCSSTAAAAVESVPSESPSAFNCSNILNSVVSLDEVESATVAEESLIMTSTESASNLVYSLG